MSKILDLTQRKILLSINSKLDCIYKLARFTALLFIVGVLLISYLCVNITLNNFVKNSSGVIKYEKIQ